MNQTSATTSSTNGATAAHELFALTDEQILEIEPGATDDPAGVEQPLLAVPDNSSSKGKTNREISGSDQSKASTKSQVTDALAQAGVPVLPAEPPAWLARQMKDPWSGEEARELWDGVLRAQAETAEYRAAIATPAEAKSLKEIYPGGVEQARAAAERARALDEFDAAYFGAAGKSAEETSATRTALAQRMLREDPAAFQEMVLAGVKALEEAKKRGSNEATTRSANPGNQAQQNPALPATSPEMQRHMAAYSEFEKAANQDLEKSVGATIERALRQALPNAKAGEGDALTARLSSGVRQEIEKALQGDRQLGEQVAQLLASRRFDDAARAQVVRLINDRAQQLVPSATKRVLNDWTQATLAAHRAKTEKHEPAVVSSTAGGRADLAPAQQGREIPRLQAGKTSQPSARNDNGSLARGRIDYRKLTDEQILEL